MAFFFVHIENKAETTGYESSPPEHRYQICPEPKGSGGGSRDA